MISLLTEELKNFENKVYNNNYKIKEKNSYENIIENNIKCKFHNNSNYINEYSLNIHSFNPTKNSPPNEWQYRLIKRINSFTY